MNTPEELMDAAMDVAAQAADGRLKPQEIEAQTIARCREIMGTVYGPDDPAWTVQLDISRQIIAMNGHPADELAEWLAVIRQREGKPVEPAPSAVSWIEQALADGADDEDPQVEDVSHN